MSISQCSSHIKKLHRRYKISGMNSQMCFLSYLIRLSINPNYIIHYLTTRELEMPLNNLLEKIKFSDNRIKLFVFIKFKEIINSMFESNRVINSPIKYIILYSDIHTLKSLLLSNNISKHTNDNDILDFVINYVYDSDLQTYNFEKYIVTLINHNIIYFDDILNYPNLINKIYFNIKSVSSSFFYININRHLTQLTFDNNYYNHNLFENFIVQIKEHIYKIALEQPYLFDIICYIIIKYHIKDTSLTILNNNNKISICKILKYFSIQYNKPIMCQLEDTNIKIKTNNKYSQLYKSFNNLTKYRNYLKKLFVKMESYLCDDVLNYICEFLEIDDIIYRDYKEMKTTIINLVK